MVYSYRLTIGEVIPLTQCIKYIASFYFGDIIVCAILKEGSYNKPKSNNHFQKILYCNKLYINFIHWLALLKILNSTAIIRYTI